MNAIAPPLIARGILTRRSLQDQVAVVTGGGRGIGREAARALAWLGAHTIIAEIDTRQGRETAAQINQELRPDSSTFIHTDVGDEESVNHLARQVVRLYGRADILVHNAAVLPVGSVQEHSIRTWDASYRVNLRGAVLITRLFLPLMLQQDSGVLLFLASTGGKYCAAFETMKSAQVELAHILTAELDRSGVIAFSLDPGRVHTPGSQAIARQIATLHADDPGAPEPEELPAESAGAAIAAAVALAPRHRGQDIHALDALRAACIPLEGSSA